MVRDIKEIFSGHYEGKADSTKWGSDFTLMCTALDQFPYAEKCLNYFDSLPEETERELIGCIYRYYKKMMEFFTDEDIEELSQTFEEMKGLGSVAEEDILQRVHMGSIIVDEECRQDRIEFHVECGCDWEIEHGLEITISDGEILYVGPFEDNPPYLESLKAESPSEDLWNFALDHSSNACSEAV